MHILADILELFLHPDLVPETPRGWLTVSLIYGLVMSGVLGYTLADSPSQGDIAVILTYLGAPLGLIYSALHFVREPDDRRLSFCTFLFNGIALIFALVLSN